MKVLLTGPHWSGGDLMSSIASGFSEAGHEVKLFYDDRKNFYSYPRKSFYFLNIPRYYNFFSDKYRCSLGREFSNFVYSWKPETVISVNGHNFMPEIISSISNDLKIPFAAWLVDDVANWPDTPILSYLHAYSHIFVGDEAWISSLKLIKADQPIFCVPQGGDPHIFKPIRLEKVYDLSLVGNFLPNNPLFGISFLRVSVLKFLAKDGFNIKIIGAGADGIRKYFNGFKNVDIQNGSISDEELNEIYNKTKISISLMAPQYRNDFSARIFNAALAECFQLSDYKNNISKYFSNGEMPFFKDLGELKRLVIRYLDDDIERERLAKLSRATVLAAHTWAYRAKEILHLIRD